MTTKKKTTTKASPDKRKKARRQRLADARGSTSQAIKARETDAASVASLPTSTNQPAATEKRPKTSSRPAGKPGPKFSALDAAAKVLGETGLTMSCPEMIAAMAEKGYWSSPHGRTPAATLYSALLRELQTKGAQARFVKTDRGKFALRKEV
jgi:vancomycin resistance protein YoaR